MKNTFLSLAALLLVCSSAIAEDYKLHYVLELPNKEPLTGFIVSEDGRSKTITEQNISMRLQPTKDADGSVRIKAEIWQLNKDVKEKHIASGTLVTKLNEPGEISHILDDGSSAFSLTVNPTPS
jgi:hypothetical protein